MAAEHRTVREGVGIMDMTLMAKFMVQGADAAAVLSRLSANDVDREVGRVVYTQWLTPKGGIAADLTVTRSGRGAVPRGGVRHHPAPGGADGPPGRPGRRARDGHRRDVGDDAAVGAGTAAPASCSVGLSSADLSNDAFPYLTAQSIDVGFAPALALRVTYLGELGYELHVPTEYGLLAYDSLMEAGADLGVRPVGLAAMAGLRLEKGYRDLGVDIDNTDNPLQAGLGFAVAFDKPGGFIGRDALLELRDRAPYPALLVGLLVAGSRGRLLFGNEAVLCDGAYVGYVRAGGLRAHRGRRCRPRHGRAPGGRDLRVARLGARSRCARRRAPTPSR